MPRTYVAMERIDGSTCASVGMTRRHRACTGLFRRNTRTMRRLRPRLIVVYLSVAFAFVAGFGTRAWIEPSPTVAGATAVEARAENFGLFWEAWDLVTTHYAQPQKI